MTVEILEHLGQFVGEIDPAQQVILGCLDAPTRYRALHMDALVVKVQVPPLEAEQFTEAHSRQNGGQQKGVQVPFPFGFHQHRLNLGGGIGHDLLRVRFRRRFLAEAAELRGRIGGDDAIFDRAAQHVTQRCHDVPHRGFRQTGGDFRSDQLADIGPGNLIQALLPERDPPPGSMVGCVGQIHDERKQMLFDNLRIQGIDASLGALPRMIPSVV